MANNNKVANISSNMSQSKYFYEAFQSLFVTKEDTDMVFVIHGKELPAHKLIIQSRSPALRAMIRGQLAPENSRYPIDDPEITFEDFDNFVKFLYTDDCVINEENVRNLMRLGDMYDIRALLETCTDNIVQWFDMGNIFKYAELGLLYCYSCSLLDRCLLKIASGCFGVHPLTYKNEKYDLSLTPVSPELALVYVKQCSRKYVLNEEIIFREALSWGQRITTNHAELKTVMEPLLPHIKFDKMDPFILATVVFQSNLLSPEKFSAYISQAVIAANKKKAASYVPPMLYNT